MGWFRRKDDLDIDYKSMYRNERDGRMLIERENAEIRKRMADVAAAYVRMRDEARNFTKAIMRKNKRIDREKYRADRMETALRSVMLTYHRRPESMGTLLRALEADLKWDMAGSWKDQDEAKETA